MKNKVLMCPPKYFSVAYEINPWMSTSNQINVKVANAEWKALANTYQNLGVEIELIEPEKDLPDLVFTANAGLVYKNIFFPSNFRFKERQAERPIFINWFKSKGYKVR